MQMVLFDIRTGTETEFETVIYVLHMFLTYMNAGNARYIKVVCIDFF